MVCREQKEKTQKQQNPKKNHFRLNIFIIVVTMVFKAADHDRTHFGSRLAFMESLTYICNQPI